MKILARVLAVWSAVLLPIIAAVSANQIFQSQRDVPLQVDESQQVSIRNDRLHTIQLDQDGTLRGQIQGQSNSGTLFIEISRNGQVLGQSTVNAQNEFVVENLTPGLAAFTVRGSAGFAIFGLDIRGWEPDRPSMASQSLEFGIVKERFGSAQVFVDQQQDFIPFEPEEEDHKIIGGNRIILEAGRLRGRIWDANKELATQSTVAIFVQGEPVELTNTDDQGYFEFANLTAGIHDIAVRGPNGVAALRIELFEGETDEFPTGQEVDSVPSKPAFEIMLAQVTQSETGERSVGGVAAPVGPGIGPGGLIIPIIPIINGDRPIVTPPPQSPIR